MRREETILTRFLDGIAPYRIYTRQMYRYTRELWRTWMACLYKASNVCGTQVEILEILLLGWERFRGEENKGKARPLKLMAKTRRFLLIRARGGGGEKTRGKSSFVKRRINRALFPFFFFFSPSHGTLFKNVRLKPGARDLCTCTRFYPGLCARGYLIHTEFQPRLSSPCMPSNLPTLRFSTPSFSSLSSFKKFRPGRIKLGKKWSIRAGNVFFFFF